MTMGNQKDNPHKRYEEAGDSTRSEGILEEGPGKHYRKSWHAHEYQ